MQTFSLENSPGWSSTDKEHFSMQSGERDVRKRRCRHSFGYAAP